MDPALPKIYDLLYRLGVTANYTGFFYTACAVSLCVERQERLSLATKWLYPDVAKRYGVTWRAVERNIRTTVSLIWNSNRPLLERVAYRPLNQRPCPTVFLAMVSQYVLYDGIQREGEYSHEAGGERAVCFPNNVLEPLSNPCRLPLGETCD